MTILESYSTATFIGSKTDPTHEESRGNNPGSLFIPLVPFGFRVVSIFSFGQGFGLDTVARPYLVSRL
jgi:hypothetical protein